MIRRWGWKVLGLAAVVLLAGIAGGSTTGVAVAEDNVSVSTERPEKMLVYVGTFTRGKNGSKGIYVYELDMKTGLLEPVSTASDDQNPGFLAIHPNKRFLYAVNTMPGGKGKNNGGVSAYAIDPKTGKLTFLNRQASEGNGPCHLAVDATGKNVLVANYGSGSIASLPVGPDGKLKKAASAIQHEGSSIHPTRQKGPHAHSINADPDGKFAFAADLGLDQVIGYKIDPSTGKLIPTNSVRVPAGGGPRHFTFHPSGKFAYVINELNSTITAFVYDPATGMLTPYQNIGTLPLGVVPKNTTAEVQVHPSGKFLYGSNRGHDSIAVFAINEQNGKLTALEHVSTQGETPRNFGIDPTGKFLLVANQNTDNVVVFEIDPETGRLTSTGIEVKIPSPVCVKFLPKAK
ncbi:6-phosphogluconolactonase [Planctomycetes bacterium Pan216]|uniref:6-phosphogluconolactonase n=1 Tax=Kolteria novifilia TaxID=2527975 RepID=A0A518AWT1_9BACT|nr:6-phosphogluconolactonase [Planctomycetes bacterium Pan216]